MEMVGLKISVVFYGEVDGTCDAIRCMHVRSDALLCSYSYSGVQHKREEMGGTQHIVDVFDKFLFIVLLRSRTQRKHKPAI